MLSRLTRLLCKPQHKRTDPCQLLTIDYTKSNFKRLVRYSIMHPQTELIERCLSVANELIDAGDHENAATLCKKVLTLDSSNVDALNLMCLLTFQQGKTRLSLSFLDRVIQQMGETPELLLNRAILLQKVRRFRDAVQVLKHVITLVPGSPEPYTYLAEIYRDLGRPDNALTAINHALELSNTNDPNLEQRLHLQSQIQATPALTLAQDVEHNGAFCILPWIHSYFFPNGMATLCCVSGTPLMDDNNAPMNIQTHSLEEIWDSTALRNVRKAMLNGKKLSNCSNCYNEEKFSSNSHRLQYNARWLHNPGYFDIPDLMQHIRTQHEKPIIEKPISVDYRFGNICNLKCQICNAGNSSQIEKDEEHARWNQAPFVRITPNRFSSDDNHSEWYESAQLIEEINHFSSDVLDVKLAGGEPTLNKSLLAFMQGLVDSGKAKNVELSISTNFTTGNRNLYKVFAAFKRIRVFVSIDGYGSMNDYLRFPSKWVTIEKNVKYAQELRKTVPVEIAIAPVLNAYNTLTITELFEWADRMGFGNVADVVRGVDHIDCLILPKTTRTKAIQRLKEYTQKTDDPRTLSFVNTLCEKLNDEWKPPKIEKCVADFVKFTHYIDTSRNLSFKTVAPETFQDMLDYYGEAMSPLQRNINRIPSTQLPYIAPAD